MTKFWPLSIMLDSPALRAEQKLELMNYRLTSISERTFHACRSVAGAMQGYDVTMLYTEGAPLKRVYLKRPTQENWLAMERCALIDTGNNFGLNVEALH